MKDGKFRKGNGGRLAAVAVAIAILHTPFFILHSDAAPKARSSFAKPPAASSVLKMTQTKDDFKSGYVFVDGKYIPPPYKVARSGTVIKINGLQVSNEIVPWSDFVMTQEGATATKKEIAPAAGGETPAAEPEPEPEPEVEEDDDDDLSSLDDLFDDEPSEKKAKKPAKKKKTYKPRPKVATPKTTIVYSFSGEFKPNEKTSQYVKKINAERTEVEKKLRSGSVLLFGAKYGSMGRLELTPIPAKAFLSRLPELLKSAGSFQEFQSACRQSGFSYLTPVMMADLYRNRLQYQQLIERNKQEAQKSPWD